MRRFEHIFHHDYEDDKHLFPSKANEVWFEGVLFPEVQTARWAVFFEKLGLKWSYRSLTGQGLYEVMAFELPELAAPYKRLVVSASEPESWAIHLAGAHGAALLIGEPRMKQGATYIDQFWYKIVMRQHEQYVFAICRYCMITVEISPAFNDPNVRYVDANYTEHKYKYSRGEGWPYCRCRPESDSAANHLDYRLFVAADVAQNSFR